jgi:RNA methyltransferase, TrmH family
MTIPQLRSKDNPLFKMIRLVSSGARRAPKQLVIAEGIRVLEEVAKADHEIEAVVFSEDFGANPKEKKLLEQWISKKIRVYKTEGKVFQSISTVKTPQGAIALIKVPEITLASVVPSRNALMLCACGVQDPGNLGTLIRTGAAVGIDLMCTTKGTVSARNPKAIRSSAGAFFRVPVVEHAEVSEFRHYCEMHSIRLFSTDPREGVIYTEADLKSPAAIILGNEGAGFSEEAFSAVPALRIPMADEIESLNVAVAGALVLFEASRQRGHF